MIGLLLPFTIILLMLLYFIPFGAYFKATLSGLEIGLMELFLMRMRKVPAMRIVELLIMADKAGVKISREHLEMQYLAGGDIGNLVAGIIAARKAGLQLEFKRAAAANLAGIDILDAVKKKLDNQDVELKIFN